MRREVAQSIQEARKLNRSVENVASSLTPLADGGEHQRLDEITRHTAEITDLLTKLYQSIAPSAFGQDESV